MFKPAILVGALLCALSSHAFAVDSDGTLPDPKLTPGAVRVTEPDEIICKPKGGKKVSTKTVRDGLTGAVKEEAYRRYGLKSHRDGWCNTERGCEVDHLISLQLGGSNSIENLWPEPYEETEWNAVVKDELETELNKRVCSGRMTLIEAQTMIRNDWIGTYKRLIGPKPD